MGGNRGVQVPVDIDARSGALVGAGLVVAHWLLDWIAHDHDVPVLPGGTRYGLGLWRSVPGTLAVELGMFAVGVALYTRATSATGPVGRWGWPILALLMAGSFVIATVGPPPASMSALVAAMGGLLVIVTGASIAIDRQRPSR